MTLVQPQRTGYQAYSNDSVLSATPIQLLTMLYDRLLLDAHRAAAAQEAGSWTEASTHLLHAQAIVDELTVSLKPDAWEGAESLGAIYSFVSTALINANVDRDIQQTRDCIALLEPLRQAWHEAAELLPAQDRTPTTGDGSLGIG